MSKREANEMFLLGGLFLIRVPIILCGVVPCAPRRDITTFNPKWIMSYLAARGELTYLGARNEECAPPAEIAKIAKLLCYL